jgi:hypothetical protein
MAEMPSGGDFPSVTTEKQRLIFECLALQPPLSHRDFKNKSSFFFSAWPRVTLA